MIGRMFPIAATLAIGAGVAAAIFRRILDARLDRDNVALLARRHDLDPETAARLYALAREDGFGSAWGEVVEQPAVLASHRERAPRLLRTPDRAERKRA